MVLSMDVPVAMPRLYTCIADRLSSLQNNASFPLHKTENLNDVFAIRYVLGIALTLVEKKLTKSKQLKVVRSVRKTSCDLRITE